MNIITWIVIWPSESNITSAPHQRCIVDNTIAIWKQHHHINTTTPPTLYHGQYHGRLKATSTLSWLPESNNSISTQQHIVPHIKCHSYLKATPQYHRNINSTTAALYYNATSPLHHQQQCAINSITATWKQQEDINTTTPRTWYHE